MPSFSLMADAERIAPCASKITLIDGFLIASFRSSRVSASLICENKTS
jgi:hypothetical protein